ncbi:MAG: N-6 DNA methylase, partial [Eubacterium sp.]
MQTLERENRFATKDEQETLSQYVGWGGLADAFDPDKSAWSTQYQELKSLLSEEAYRRAKESTLTAFYTPPVVIQVVYQAIERMGFQSGNLLEPACGIGHFIGMLPDPLKETRIYGVELDLLSGEIARQLYQKSTIVIQGFEHTDFPDNFFDVAVGNVPFGDFNIADQNYNQYHFKIHDYFFAKTMDKVRPGGVIAFITSKGTLDKANPTFRRYLSERAELIGALRLPDNTFKQEAGTEVTADILFLQKRERLSTLEPEWLHLDKDPQGIEMNAYFANHPEMIVGEMRMESGPFGPESHCKAVETKPFSEQLKEAINHLHGAVHFSRTESFEAIEGEEILPADLNVRNFSYTYLNNTLYYRE